MKWNDILNEVFIDTDGKKVAGYWRKTSKEKSFLPFPVFEPIEVWDGKTFAKKLERKEKHAGKKECKGWSTCRICKKQNGTAEYTSGGWKWPEGLKHYIDDHNVKPDDDFVNFINK